MDHKTFCTWLQGFLDGAGPVLSKEQVEAVKAKLAEVKGSTDLPYVPVPLPYYPSIQVPYIGSIITSDGSGVIKSSDGQNKACGCPADYSCKCVWVGGGLGYVAI